ncbi:hypothetical protein JNUCC74_01055 [Cerasibacillus sp. JNUCC 74]
MRKLFLSFIVFALLITNFSIPVNASEANVYDEKEVEELANVLEILFDKSIVYGIDGGPVGYSRGILEKELSKFPEYIYLIDELEKEGVLIDDNRLNQSSIQIRSLRRENPKWVNYSERCIRKGLSNAFGPAAITGVWEAIRDGNFKKGAKKLLKLGVKGSIPGIMATAMWEVNKCNSKANKKYKRWL